MKPLHHLLFNKSSDTKLTGWRVMAIVLAASPIGLFGGCSISPTAQGAAEVARPKLIVFLVIDGLPQRQVLSYRDQMAPDGFSRFLERGTWFASANYGHSNTVTAAGHATMLTGAYPSQTGIIGNEWQDPQTGEMQYCTADASATYIGHKTNALDGTSPKNLKVETVGDVLRRVDARSKVIAISGKDRGAILPAGKSGTAYMYMGATGQFASSTHYMRAHPAWVAAFNAGKPADRFFKTSWTPLLPEAAYARSIADHQKWFGPSGGGLPVMMGAVTDESPGPLFYSGLLRSPFADALTLDFARAAIAGESLGGDEAPDILAISLSGHDYVNHAFSAESRISHDHFLQLDRQLQSFFADLDAKVGKDNFMVVLTADHGFMPAPDHSAALGQDSGRINRTQLQGRVNLGLEARFGAGKWVLGTLSSSLLLNKKLMAKVGIDSQAVTAIARDLLVVEPGIAVAYTAQELSSNSRVGAPFFESMRKSWHPDVSGEIQFAVKPHWMFGSSTSVATHGSPHSYDTQVPILIYGPQWVKPGRVDASVEVIDIAPTLAQVLQIAAPAASAGNLLPMVIRR